jgi:hypothetical protein
MPKRKVDRSKVGKASRNKGSRAERELLQALNEWTLHEPTFKRNKGGEDQYSELFRGDIIPDYRSVRDMAQYPYALCFESKFVEGWELSKLLVGQAQQIQDFWKQTMDQVDGTKLIPVLVLRKSRHKPLCLLPQTILPEYNYQTVYKYEPDHRCFVWDNLMIFSLENFTKIFNYNTFAKVVERRRNHKPLIPKGKRREQ